jgi:hypothetical protein
MELLQQAQDLWHLIKMIGVIEILTAIVVIIGLYQIHKDTECYIRLVAGRDAKIIMPILDTIDRAREAAGVKEEDNYAIAVNVRCDRIPDCPKANQGASQGPNTKAP